MLKPLKNNIVIELAKAEAKTASGIYIPESAQETAQKGVVIQLSDTLTSDKTQLKVGDNVVYKKYSGTEMVIDDKTYLIIDVSDILAIIN